MPGANPVTIELSSAGISVAGERVDVTAGRDAVTDLRRLLGPVVASDPTRVPRTVHVLQTGVVILAESATDDLVSFVVCFQPDGSPYPTSLHEVPVFQGTVACAAGSLAGGESDGQLLRVPGIGGFAGALGMSDGALHLHFHLRKPRNRFGKRSGARRLIGIVAEWGGVKPFPS